MLSNAVIAEAIEARLAEISAEATITREEWLRELKRHALGDIRRVITWKAQGIGIVYDEETGEERLAVSNQVQLVNADDLSEDAAASIAEVSQTDKGGIRVKLHDKIKALELYGKAAGFLKDGEGAVQVNVGVQLVGIPERETREQWLERKARERAERLAAPDERAA